MYINEDTLWLIKILGGMAGVLVVLYLLMDKIVDIMMTVGMN